MNTFLEIYEGTGFVN